LEGAQSVRASYRIDVHIVAAEFAERLIDDSGSKTEIDCELRLRGAAVLTPSLAHGRGAACSISNRVDGGVATWSTLVDGVAGWSTWGDNQEFPLGRPNRLAVMREQIGAYSGSIVWDLKLVTSKSFLASQSGWRGDDMSGHPVGHPSEQPEK
jgi:hypothetical protein